MVHLAQLRQAKVQTKLILSAEQSLKNKTTNAAERSP